MQKNQLVQDLDRFRQDRFNELPEKDDRRMRYMKQAFHDKFVGWLKERIEKRPSIADAAYCKARCEEPTFREGYQHGVSMTLAILGMSIQQYQSANTTHKARKTYYYLTFLKIGGFIVPKSNQEMLDPKLGTKILGLL